MAGLEIELKGASSLKLSPLGATLVTPVRPAEIVFAPVSAGVWSFGVSSGGFSEKVSPKDELVRNPPEV
jgi:hypothetical protein